MFNDIDATEIPNETKVTTGKNKLKIEENIEITEVFINAILSFFIRFFTFIICSSTSDFTWLCFFKSSSSWNNFSKRFFELFVSSSIFTE
ncbi:hypothetical protein NWE60_00875 [Mycoplasmopsis felis]|nr:hypothetical protein [Mycoplasmopsis felis]WAM01212.1 hypothetical protein NWE60_00875 [Mycoplasmopsis felis]